jgi:hypothetical protein
VGEGNERWQVVFLSCKTYFRTRGNTGIMKKYMYLGL